MSNNHPMPRTQPLSCARCLLTHRTTPAITILGGIALCGQHLQPHLETGLHRDPPDRTWIEQPSRR